MEMNDRWEREHSEPSDVSEDLTAAAMWGNVTLLEGLLENGADPNLPNSAGNSALHVAASYGETECASILLSCKANVNTVGTEGKTPLHCAVCGICMQVPGERHPTEAKIQDNQMDLVRLLVAHDANLDIADDSGATPRDLALQIDFYDCADLIDELKDLKGRDAAKRLREQRLKDLLAACKSGDMEVVRQVLPFVSDVINEHLTKDTNLLMLASQRGYLSIVEALADHGAVALACPSTNLTALHLACSAGHTDVTISLLNRLPALLAIDDSPGETSLHIAARVGHEAIVTNLLAIASRREWLLHRIAEGSNAECDIAFVTASGEKVKMNESLPEIPFDIMAATVNDKRTPLHEAAAKGHITIVKLLIDFMLESASKHGGGGTPSTTETSPRSGYLEPSPIASGRPDSSLFNGFSPQHLQLPRGQGALDVDAMTLKGRTAFHEAAHEGYFDVMEALLVGGANINAYMRPSLDTTINVELTALVQACLMNRIDIVRFLLQHGATDARLKALSRTLRKRYDNVAGVLLCFNGGVAVVSSMPAVASKMPARQDGGAEGGSKEATGPVDLATVSWNSKHLGYLREQWLEAAVLEPPRLTEHAHRAISHLDVSSNELTALPLAVFKLPHVIQLELNRNKLSSLPCLPDEEGGGWSCHRLQQLDVSSNCLALLPACLFSLDELREVNANGNAIKEVPPALWSALKLLKLYLSRNEIDTFPTLPAEVTPWELDSVGTPQSLAISVGVGNATADFAGNVSPPDSGYSGSQPSFPHQPLRADSSVLDYHSYTDQRRKSIGLPFATSMGRRGTSIKNKVAQSHSITSRRFKDFHESANEAGDLDEGELSAEEVGSVLPLEVIDLSRNHLVEVPSGLSCLATKLQKLNLSFNRIKSLGQISDYPADLELLDVSNNELATAISPGEPCPTALVCARRLLQACGSQPAFTAESVSPYAGKLCRHRLHRNLARLATLKLNSNALMDVQLFRMLSKPKAADLVTSFEESTMAVRKRAGTNDPYALVVAPEKPVHAVASPAPSESRRDLVHSQVLYRTSSKKRGWTRVGVDTAELSERSDHHESIIERSERHERSDRSERVENESHRSDSSHSHSSGSREGSGSSHAAQSPSMVVSPLFPQLSTLEVARNKLKSVPANIHLLTSLSCLVISHNPSIDTLPLELSNLEHLWNLEYEGCPLTNPPASDLDKFRLAGDKLQYMRALLHDAKPNESMKLMLVGLQRMGKTTLLSRLREANELTFSATTFMQRVTGENPLASSNKSGGLIGLGRRNKGESGTLSTVGVDLGVWKYRKDLEPDYLRKVRRGIKPLRSVTFYTWDFGGQEEYYVTHQCFLSARSLYLMVWDVTQGEEGIEGLGPWLHNIQARAPDSPVVIVGTHCDRLRGDGEKERRKAELNALIYEKYLVGRGPNQLRELGLPRILDVIYVSCPTSGRAEGIADLRMALYDIAFALNVPRVSGNPGIARMKLLEQPIPASFLWLEERVRELAAECRHDDRPPVLKENLFRECTKDIIANPRELNQAAAFLHENGIMLHYATPALSHLYFVDPQWLCDMLAHVVTVPEVNRFIQRQNGPEVGILKTSVLAHVFRGKHFPQAYRKEYIELLGKFEVALLLDRNRLLVPSMLAARPRYTVHTFRNVFPRPPLADILARSPETPKLFSGSSGVSVESGESREVFGTKETEGGGQTDLGIATHVSEELCRTGLLLRRFYFMTYVPSGFWPRLVSRFLTSPRFATIVLRSLGHPAEEISEIASNLVKGQMSGATGLEWSYWQTGIELWYKGQSLLRVAEILPQGFQGCLPSPSIFEQSTNTPIEPVLDCTDISFELNGQWMPVEITPNRGIEVILPDTVCPTILQKELTTRAAVPKNSQAADDEAPPPLPQTEQVWMSAGLLALAVDYIDTLLEDWYPGLGAREGNRTVESIPYVNRIVPCPFCVSHTVPYVPEEYESDRSGGPLTLSDSPKCKRSRGERKRSSNSASKSTPPPVMPKSGKSSPLLKHEAGLRARSSDVIHSGSPAVKAKRSLFSKEPSSPRHNRLLRNNSVDPPANGASVHSTGTDMRVRSLSSPPESLNVVGEGDQGLAQRVGSLGRLHHMVPPAESSFISDPLAIPLPPDNPAEMCLTLATRFGFMIESCVLAARRSEDMICPAHRDQPLRLRDIAPDVMFADLPNDLVLNPNLVDKGEYIDHGTFGDIYHGHVYPSVTATDDEGLDVAIKIDRLDSKKCTSDTATRAYIEVRAEVSILHSLHHPHIIDFIGVVLQPLCFILEWAAGGSLSSMLHKYRKLDARLAPRTLQLTAFQVASGLAYLHEHAIVYYDLKSPNVLVFQFPSPQDSLQASQSGSQAPASECPVYIKIADMGISRRMTPGGVMGFKGSPGFMAPEILKYVGTEACTEKVDVFSFGMFLYELISLYFPFEKQNLMGSQIEKLIIEGERPTLQNRELNNPILYLDTMRWCWQQDYRSRPSADQLVGSIANESVSRLVDAISLHNTTQITCACICTLPIQILSPELNSSLLDDDRYAALPASPSGPSSVAQGDLQEDLWLCMYTPGGEEEEETVGSGGEGEEEGARAEVCIINFKRKASLFTESFTISNSKITSICGVNDTMWLGTEKGIVFIYDAISRNLLLERLLAVLPGQGITSITHVSANHQVLVTRRDGCILLFDEGILERKLPDDSRYDNRINATQLPVRSSFKTPEKLPILCSHVLALPSEGKMVLWCGTKTDVLLAFDIYPSRIEYCRKRYGRSRYKCSEEDCITQVVAVENGGKTCVWALSRPDSVLYCWDGRLEQLLQSVRCDQFTSDPVTGLCAMGSQLELSISTGKILLLSPSGTGMVASCVELSGHVKEIHTLLSIGGRVFPKHWLPSIIGRSNVMDYYRDLLGEEDIQSITSTMYGRQSRLLVSIGGGFHGLAGRLVEPLMTHRDQEDNFVLLWDVSH